MIDISMTIEKINFKSYYFNGVSYNQYHFI